jgi:hypothetical protein
MSYEYDSKMNRELAKTAMSIYVKAHDIKQEETAPSELQEQQEETVPSEFQEQFALAEQIQTEINSLLLEYIANAVMIIEEKLDRELSEEEIEKQAASIFEEIEKMSKNDQLNFVQELAEEYGQKS